jgi:hypothetical protein
VITLFAILVLTVVAPVGSTPDTSYTLAVNRRAFINEWGVVAINDTVTVRNTGTEPVTGIRMGLPREYASDLDYLSSRDQYRIDVVVKRDANPSSPIYWMDFEFPSPVMPQKSYQFSTVMVIDNIVKYFEGTFIYRFADAPSLQIKASPCNVTVLLPQGSAMFLPPNFTFTQVEIGGMPSLTHTFDPLEPNRDTSMSFNFTSVSIQFMDVSSVEREISFGGDGYIHVADTYAVRNLAAAMSSLSIQLPKGATGIRAYDPAGPLWTEEQETTQASVSPRYGTLRGNENFTFTLSYRLPTSYVKQVKWWGQYELAFDFLTSHPWMVDKLTVRVVMEEGMKLEKSSQNPTSSYMDHGKTVHVYDFNGVTPLHNLTFTIEYKYLSFWTAFRPITWLAAVEAIVAVFLVASRGKKVMPVTVAPLETIRRFVGLYDERTALRLEIDRLQEDMARGGISKHDYRRRRKDIDSRLDEINRSLGSVKQQLRSAAGRYDEMIRKLDKAEAEIDAAKASEAQVRVQYRSGKINKDVYETVLSDVRKRVARARETIESTSITLREEAR